MHQPHEPLGHELAPLFDHAEKILVAQMPEPIARAIIDLARRGTDLPQPRTPSAPATQQAATEEPQFVTTREAAERLRVSEKQIYRLVEQGKLQRYGLGRRHRFQQSDIAALLVEQQSASSAVRAARLAAEARRAS